MEYSLNFGILRFSFESPFEIFRPIIVRVFIKVDHDRIGKWLGAVKRFADKLMDLTRLLPWPVPPLQHNVHVNYCPAFYRRTPVSDAGGKRDNHGAAERNPALAIYVRDYC